ncbi:MAG: hypothetical protein Gaeavirus20_8 [Gaeavirus sp.]|uniref:Uncharacterized protein n=1 Tax=Gaeavirus sp. TaxID=2487767 RepID=A0A3G5A344_9VIRU|nr:MAG: hypothetical protein Gaeavirus20_8 [Gaeavirus sp.]
MKKLAILITGEMRTCSLGKGTNTTFINTFKQNVLTDDIMKNYEINIFFVTDKADKDKVHNYFGQYLKNLLMLDHNNIQHPLNLQTYIDNYHSYYGLRKNNPDLYPIVNAPRPSYIHMFYKLYCAHQLMTEYEQQYNIKHDYIFRLRPDCHIISKLYPQIKHMENNNLEIMISWDWGYLSTRNLSEHICNLIYHYGKYNYGEIIHSNNILKNLGCDGYHEYAKTHWPCWSESPEVQLWEHIITYFKEYKLDENKISNHNFFVINEDRHTVINW